MGPECSHCSPSLLMGAASEAPIPHVANIPTHLESHRLFRGCGKDFNTVEDDTGGRKTQEAFIESQSRTLQEAKAGHRQSLVLVERTGEKKAGDRQDEQQLPKAASCWPFGRNAGGSGFFSAAASPSDLRVVFL